MTSSASSQTKNVSGGTRKKGSRNRARPRQEKVQTGRVSKHQNKASHRRVSTNDVPDSTENVPQDPRDGFATAEVISSSGDDAYEHTGTDDDSSEGSGSPTDMDTPTSLAVEERRKAKGKNREKITSRRLASPKNLVRTTQSTPGGRLSSSIRRSSPCDKRTPAVVRRRSTSPATRSSPPPTGNARFLSIEPPSSLGDTDTPGTSCPDTDKSRVRKNTVNGGERQLLDFARELIVDFTLFRSPFPSALDLTEIVHLAWADSQQVSGLNMEASQESLALVSRQRTKYVYKRTLNVI